MMLFKVHRISGDSMSPAFLAGDYVVSFRWPLTPLREGDVLVVNHPSLGVIIKRVASILPEGQFTLKGDNPQSTSSETMGCLSRKHLIGRVFWRISL